MTTTIASEPSARSNQALGGRPVDPVIEAFDAAMEALVALRDDQAAIDHALHGLVHLRRCVCTLEDHLVARVRRLTSVSIPEVERIAQELDGVLSSATLRRRVARRAQQKAIEAAS